MDAIEFKKWGFKRGEEFTGLMPKVMELLGEQYCTGSSEEIVSSYDVTANGVDQMKVVSPQLIALSENSESGDTPDSGSTPESGETPDSGVTPDTGETEDHDFTRPEEKPNTAEQDATANAVISEAMAATKAVKITIPSGETLNNLTIPEDAPQFIYITGACADGATITNKSGKGLSITNTNEEPVSIVIDSPNASIYLGGNYKDIWTNKSISSASGVKPTISGTVTFDENITGDVSVSGIFEDGAMIQTLTTGTLSVTNSNENASIEIYAPNGDVSLGSKYAEVTATVAENTLYLKPNSHINTLTMKKGNVLFYGLDEKDFVDTFVSEGTIGPVSLDVPTDVAVGKMVNNGGIYNLVEDITTGTTLAFGLFASGKYRYNLNGHTLSISNKNYNLFLRGSAEVNIYGDGKFVNTGGGYGCWVSSENAVLNVYGGEIEGQTHTLYAEKGTINVYGGTFKLANAESADRDVNGNLKFLVNCLDSSYTSGIAKINIYGGKFYEFNPAVSYSEPNGPISFVAEGYHVVESVEDGKKVYEVVKD